MSEYRQNHLKHPVEENRRILAVDDDEALLLLYQQIFTLQKGVKQSSEALLDTLSKGVGGSRQSASAEQRSPYQLECYLNGVDAVAAVEGAVAVQLNYAVALIDLRMPQGIDGMETARQIRALDEDIQIIFVTAYSDYSTDEIFQQISGAVLWFRKPFHSEELYQVVRNCCTSWNQAHQLERLRRDLASRVELQTERLNARMQSVSILQKNSLKRELRMGAMKRELSSLKAYQDLRLLLSGEPLPEPQPLDSAQKPVELLLVDDSETVRAIYTQQLETAGFSVTVASSVEEAFAKAQQNSFEVALIDYYMPGGNGDKLIHLLRTDPHTMYILPLLFTNAGDELTAVESGAVYWMIKDQPAFPQKMKLVRDYVQDNRSQVAQQVTADLRFENRRVLAVDDEMGNLELLCTLLGAPVPNASSDLADEMKQFMGAYGEAAQREQHSFEVATALQGEDAIALVREAQFAEQPFAIALIDMRMPPGIDGLETARQIRQISPQIDIVIMTAHSDYSLEQIRDVLGYNFSFLNKPFSQDVLYQRVLEGCEKWKMVHEVNASHHALLNLAEDMEEENSLRQEAEQRLIQADQAKDQFLASMSHELRTPLTVIIGNCSFLAEKEEDAEKGQIIRSIESAGRGQLALVNDILDMSKIQSGKFTVDESPYDLEQMVLEVEHMLATRAADAGLDFEVQRNFSHEWKLLGDEQRISQILINLIGNAIKFTERGRVTVTVWNSSEYLFFKVEDSGIGMSAETRRGLFKQFQQADSSICRRFGGSGLGLFISGSLAEMMGGEITVSSREGEGSTFQLMLPYRQSDHPVEAEDERSSRHRQRLQGSVLIAEDIEELQLLERRILEQMGVGVTIANNGAEALELVQRESFDLVLMDMQMPVMDGIEATKQLRARGFELPIIALSANVMKQHRKLFAEAGCDEFLPKPIEDELLWRVLSRYLGEPQEEVLVKPIVWSERYSVGHAGMDRQHRDIAGLINQLVELMPQRKSPDSREQMLEILPRLSDAYNHHIQAEERLLKAVGYTMLESHQRSHERYVSSLVELFVGPLDESSVRSAVNTLVEWWDRHILVEDMAYTEALKEAPACEDRPAAEQRKRHRMIDDEMMELFAQSAEKNHLQLTAALENGAWSEIREVAHRIKGTALTFGFPQLADVALRTHSAVDQQVFEQVPEVCQELIDELQRV